ncbi:23S rRNA (uracil(1939)-C(5))-methyltransferase RlmD [Sutterella sp.]|uniref:23S rRNA (uracil(1939)-C(5))-methyltransferase RlmD n=1 Tax=Sutterella sp. TaxID=1981025 RepID=UPI0026E0DBB0|nr:23S rRNA (uracil(1939)-C(5))-methyltransferase RlmD [Sutterella sp.]MDO5531351.1 23S rRNA (uracil(1939)-C(5))-methyltransferase RlmD [Sutterella sp.]
MPRTKPRRTPERPLVHLDRTVVTGLDASGAGLVRSPEGLEVLVPGAIPGAEIALDYRAPAPGGRRGLAEQFTELAPSPFADPGACPLAGDCGGCPAGRISYEKALELKTGLIVAGPLRAAGLLTDENPELLRPAVGQPAACRRAFRNKAVLYPGIIGGEGRFGYFRARSQALVAAEACPQTPAWMGEAARALAPLLLTPELAPWHEATDSGVLRCLTLREAPGTAERMAVLTVRRLPAGAAEEEKLFERIRGALAGAGLHALLVNLHEAPGSAVLSFAPGATRVIAGAERIACTLEGLAFRLGAETFLQVNTPQTPVLYRTALDALDIHPGDRVLDLYCGVGTLTLLAAARGAGVLGIERVEHSIRCADENARENGFPDARFIAAPVEQALSGELPDGFVPDLVIADPAYQGLTGGAAEALARLMSTSGARRLAYVSCNPKSFARDAAVLAAGGMRLVSVTPVDMFPGAMHLEAVGVFERE